MYPGIMSFPITWFAESVIVWRGNNVIPSVRARGSRASLVRDLRTARAKAVMVHIDQAGLLRPEGSVSIAAAACISPATDAVRAAATTTVQPWRLRRSHSHLRWLDSAQDLRNPVAKFQRRFINSCSPPVVLDSLQDIEEQRPTGHSGANIRSRC